MIAATKQQLQGPQSGIKHMQPHTKAVLSSETSEAKVPSGPWSLKSDEPMGCATCPAFIKMEGEIPTRGLQHFIRIREGISELPSKGIYVCIYIYIYIHIHTYTHIHMYGHIEGAPQAAPLLEAALKRSTSASPCGSQLSQSPASTGLDWTVKCSIYSQKCLPISS